MAPTEQTLQISSLPTETKLQPTIEQPTKEEHEVLYGKAFGDEEKRFWWEKYVGKDLSVFGDAPEFAFLKTIEDPPIDHWGDEDIWTDGEYGSKMIVQKPQIDLVKNPVFDSPTFEYEDEDEFDGYPGLEIGSSSSSSRIGAIKKEKAKQRRINRLKKSRDPVWVAEQALKRAKRAAMAKQIKAAMDVTTDEEQRELRRKRQKQLRQERA